MAKCPRCKKKIDYLYVSSIGTINGVFSLEKGYPDYSDDSTDYEDSQYYCPECNKLLAKNEDRAIKILGGEQDEGV
jgi:phage FluMu protein Com